MNEEQVIMFLTMRNFIWACTKLKIHPYAKDHKEEQKWVERAIKFTEKKCKKIKEGS